MSFYNDLIEQGIAPSTRRAHQRDKAYFWQWVMTYLNETKTYPVKQTWLVAFLLWHLDYTNGHPLKVATLRRYLASLSEAHTARGMDNPCRDAQVKLILRRARVAQRHHVPEQKQAITFSLLTQMLASCDDSLKGARDKALLLVAFRSGGRRRSELANMQVDELQTDSQGYRWRLRFHKTDQNGQGLVVPIYDAAAVALTAWLNQAGIVEGPVFRSINRHAQVGQRLSGHSINTIVKSRLMAVGVNPAHYGAHSLRAGFLTEACQQGIALPVAMRLSGHRSVEVASGYYRHHELTMNPAAYLSESKKS